MVIIQVWSAGVREYGGAGERTLDAKLPITIPEDGRLPWHLYNFTLTNEAFRNMHPYI